MSQVEMRQLVFVLCVGSYVVQESKGLVDRHGVFRTAVYRGVV